MKNSVGRKIAFLVVGMAALVASLLGWVAYQENYRALSESAFKRLDARASAAASSVDQHLTRTADATAFLADLPLATQGVTVENGAAWQRTLRAFADRHDLANAWVMASDGTVLAGTGPAPAASATSTTSEGTFGRPYRTAAGTLAQHVTAPLTDSVGHAYGTLVGQIDLTALFAASGTAQGETDELMVAQRLDEQAVVLNPLRYDSTAALSLAVAPNTLLARAARGETDRGAEQDYRQTPTLAATAVVPATRWGVLAKADTAEVMAPLRRALFWYGGTTLLALLVATVVTLLLTRGTAQSLRRLREVLRLLSQGVLPDPLENDARDEIGDMTRTVNQLSGGLKRTATFANRIGEGRFDADFEPMSREDMLGLALLDMRTSLQDAEKNDEERNWIVRGVAEIGDILREHTDTKSMGEQIVAFITKRIGAVQGAFYALERPEGEAPFIEMQASYAYNKKKYLEGRFAVGQGLVGQAAIEENTILRTEIPSDYVTVTSGLLGDQRPSALLIVPLINNEEVNGVLEFAAFEKFSERDVKFVQEVSQIISRTLFNIQVNDRTRSLLSDSQQMSQELQQQQEELRQNAEEMAATQEELRRTNNELELQMMEVNNTQKRMQLLLENASEVIAIYEEDGTVRYISPSVKKILGYTAEQLVGQQDFEHIGEEHRESVQRAFAQMVKDPGEPVLLQYPYTNSQGQEIWLEALFSNQIANPAIQGILVNCRDITERRLAEQESRMRGQMQALSENSPDLITRVNREGVFFYTNPTIEQYTGQTPDYFLQKSLSEIEVPGDLTEVWQAIVAEVIDQQDKVRKEIDLHTIGGEQVVQINAIPEYNDAQDMESVLLVSHDITEQKQIEREVQNKNRKISESINYAERIQKAILPDTETLTAVFPNSFIFYRPRDVVSGDFPWMIERDGTLHLAAVDCTGHGVPGALISLIGYFLLNNIIGSSQANSSEDLMPGRILDALNEAVISTLRQTAAADSTRDGMDIAFCSIRPADRKLYYAGAHRPLYLLRDGEITQIKGDKSPIGGGQYKNRGAFQTHEIDYRAGDRILIFSDGLPDQFGGPDNRKFSPRRIRELLAGSADKPMAALQTDLQEAYQTWRGDYKQTDDILVIGIEF